MSKVTMQPGLPWRAPATVPADTARWRAQRESVAIDRLAGEMRLASFRAFLHATVDSMSALAPDVLAFVGFDIEPALNTLRPVRNWLQYPEGYRSTAGRSTGRLKYGSRGWSVRVGLWSGEPLDLRGEGIIREGALGDYLMVGVLGRSLEIHPHGVAFQLTTRAGTAHLALDRMLPETLAASCMGRPLDEVVDHPLLRGRGFVARHVEQSDCRSTLVFDCGDIPLRVPWNADGVDRMTAADADTGVDKG